MINKFNLSWLRFLVGSTSLFYIAGASVLSCFIIFYFISGTLAFLLFCGILFGELWRLQPNRCFFQLLYSFRTFLFNSGQFTLLPRHWPPSDVCSFASNLWIALWSCVYKNSRQDFPPLVLHPTSRTERKLRSNVGLLSWKRWEYRWSITELQWDLS